MSFSYDITEDRGRLRLAVGDTVQNSGARPLGRNFDDEELDAFLDDLDDGASWRLAVPPLLRQLAVEWTNKANVTIGEYSASYSAIADRFTQRAMEYEAQLMAAGLLTNISTGQAVFAGLYLNEDE